MKEFLRKFIFLFSLLDLSKIKYLFAFLLIAAVLEGIGISLVIPALSLIMGSGNEFTDLVSKYVSIESSYFAYTLLFSLFAIYIIKNLIVIFAGWYEFKISRNLKIQITDKLFNVYLYQPFSITSKATSPAVLRNINSLAQSLVTFGQSILSFFADILFVFAIFIVLLINYPKITAILSLFFLLLIFFYTSVLGKLLKKWSYAFQMKTKIFYQDVQEAIDSIKEIKLMNLGNEFKEKFNSTIVSYFDSQKKIGFFGNLGRPVVEIFGILILIIFLIIILQRNFVNTEVFNFLSLFVFVLFRMLPLITKIINTLNKFAAQIPTINILYDVFRNKSNVEKYEISYKKIDKIELKNINFSYKEEKNVLDNVNLTILKGKIIAIIGESGSGKSTLLNILSGLQKKNNGSILVNDEEISKPLFLSYKIGYIPQRPLLINKSVKTNICITTDENKINHELLNKAINQACLTEVIKKLENGIDTIIGEKSNFISGGEAQRIAIARALYAGSQILLLDEPTSSLDPRTEQILMENIKKASNDMITIITSHKMNLLKYCDKVYVLQNAKIKLKE